MAITYKEEFNLNDLRFSDVIDGLNKYFAEDETRVQVPRSFVEIQTLVSSISIKSFNKVIFIRFDAEMYLDKLISWLRTEHGIFYYPGMEAKYSKAEKRIPPFTERMKNDGALRTLKKLHKIVTGVEVSDKADSHTLIAAAIETNFAVLKQDLKNALETKGKLNYRKELMEYIAKTEKKYGVCFSDLHDDEEFRPECVFDDLVEALKKSEAELATLKEQNEILKGEVRQLNREHIAALDRIEKLNAELDDSSTSDINKLISDYCNKNDIIAPSPYFSDKACVEYLFSVVDLEREHRAAVGKQMVEDYKKDLLRSIIDMLRDNGDTETAEALESEKGDKDAVKRALNSIYGVKRGDDEYFRGEK